MQKKNMTQRQLAEILGTAETRVSEILHYRTEKFTLDRLIAYLQIVNPALTLKIA
jgi:predicted XRE-type DNA-binding protein